MMDEAEARAWVQAAFDVPRETMERLESFVAFLREENERQNLVSRASLDHLWTRHIADSAQLVSLAPSTGATWIDLGSGAGFPGLVVALLHGGRITLVEERRLRAEFLRRAAELLAVDVAIIEGKAERVPAGAYDVVSARAFAPLPRLLELSAHLSTTKTLWLLPKGRNAETELAALDSSWQGEFRLEPSVTDPEARIIVAQGVRRKTRGSGSQRKRG